jgi:hypothetical protein
MGQLASIERDGANPLDCVIELAEAREWAVDRAGADEVAMVVSAAWGDLALSLNWREDLEGLQLACTYDIKAPPQAREEVARLVTLINEQLYFGHFDIWRDDGSVHFRNGLILAGGAEANEAQCDTLISNAIVNCERYFPAFQFVIWAGKRAEEAIESTLLETVGEA